MRPNRWTGRTLLLIALVASLVIGALAATTQAVLDPNLRRPTESWEVPLARVGDRAVYARIVPADAEHDPEYVFEDENGKHWFVAETHVYTVQSVATTADGEGAQRASAQVRNDQRFTPDCPDFDFPSPNPSTMILWADDEGAEHDPPTGSSTSSGGPPEGAPTYSADPRICTPFTGFAIVEHCALADANVYRSEFAATPMGDLDPETTESTYYPGGHLCGLPGSLAQGMVLTAGTRRSDRAGEPEVAQWGRIDGAFAYGVVGHRQGEQRYREGDQPSETRTWDTTIVEWFVPSEAYPRVVEWTHEVRRGGEVVERDQSKLALVEVVRGEGEPIAWGTPMPPAEPPGEPERASAGSRHPTDGTASGLPFALADALGALEADPHFAAWRLDHRDAQLVDGLLHVPPDGAARPVWMLIHAQPDGTAYRAGIEWDGATARVAGSDTVPIDPFRLEDLPTSPITFGAAESSWRLQTRDDRPANYASFRIVEWFAPTTCERLASSAPSPHEGLFKDTPRVVHYEIVYGREDVSCQDPAQGEPRRVTSETDHDFVTIGGDGRTTGYSRSAGTEPADYEGPWSVSAAEVFPYEGFRPPALQKIGIASAATFLALAALYLWPSLKYAGAKAAFLAGFSRIDKDRLLDQRVREALLQAIKADPGASATELQQRVGAGWGTTVYHLDRLERAKLVLSTHDGRHRRFFPSGAVDWSRREAAALLKNERARQIYELISGDPGVVQEGIVGVVGLSRATIIWHLGRLEDQGLVARVKEGRKVHYFANPEPAVRAYDAKDAVEVA